MTIEQEFDYIIVEAGSAGWVLAARLSQDPNVRVAFVEAGGPDDAPEIEMPTAFPQLSNTKYYWDFASEPERRLRERRISSASRQTLGGSSAMNAMIYIRGNILTQDTSRGRADSPRYGSLAELLQSLQPQLDRMRTVLGETFTMEGLERRLRDAVEARNQTFGPAQVCAWARL
jgi:choline dehydrogenase-like flavoprotein